MTLVCSLDCTYSVKLDGRTTLTGTAVGKVAKTLRFAGSLAKGRHSLAGHRDRGAKCGAPGSAALTFRP